MSANASIVQQLRHLAREIGNCRWVLVNSAERKREQKRFGVCETLYKTCERCFEAGLCGCTRYELFMVLE